MRTQTTAAMAGGLGGALALTAVHQAAKRLSAQAPRMDLLGVEVIRRAYRAAGRKPPRGASMHRRALVGDLAANAIYYGLPYAFSRRPERALRQGLVAGALAGVGGVLLPGVLGLDGRASGATPLRAALTVAWYTLGGLVAASLYRRLVTGARLRGASPLAA